MFRVVGDGRGYGSSGPCCLCRVSGAYPATREREDLTRSRPEKSLEAGASANNESAAAMSAVILGWKQGTRATDVYDDVHGNFPCTE